MITTRRLQQIFESGRDDERVAAAADVMMHLDGWLPWLAARQFDGMSLTHKQDDWLLVLRASRGAKAEVAFVGGDSPEDCYLNCAHSLLFDLVRWKADKWGTIRSDKS